MSDIIPFGKYRGQPIAEIVQRDPAYIQWLMQQAWFPEKFAPIYQLVVNNFAPPSEETPAHNAMQARFLEFDFQWAFWQASGLSNNEKWRDLHARFAERTKEIRKAPTPCTHREYKWTLRAHREDVQRRWNFRRDRFLISHGTSIGSATFEDGCDVKFSIRLWVGFPRGTRFCEGYNSEDRFEVLIEIKPSIGDDYPAVLRQMKRQQIARRSNAHWNDKWILFVDQFSSQAITLNQARQIFAREGILIVMMDDVRNQLIKNQEEDE